MRIDVPRDNPEHWVQELDRALSEANAVDRTQVPTELLGRASVSRLLRCALVDWAVIFACWAIMDSLPAWLYPFFVLVIAAKFHSFGVILHDATHMPVRGKTLRFRLVEILTGYPISSTVNAMRYHHLRHHRDSGMVSDPYFKEGASENRLLLFYYWVRGLILIPAWTLRGIYGLAAYAVPGLRNSYGRLFLQDKTGADLTHSNEVIDCARAELGQVLYGAGIAGLTVALPGWMLFHYFVPMATMGLLASYRLLSEHRYERATDRKVSTILRITNDHNLSGLGQALFAPRNIGYHVVHHLHPTVAMENLPGLRAWYRTRYPNSYPA